MHAGIQWRSKRAPWHINGASRCGSVLLALTLCLGLLGCDSPAPGWYVELGGDGTVTVWGICGRPIEQVSVIRESTAPAIEASDYIWSARAISINQVGSNVKLFVANAGYDQRWLNSYVEAPVRYRIMTSDSSYNIVEQGTPRPSLLWRNKVLSTEERGTIQQEYSRLTWGTKDCR